MPENRTDDHDESPETRRMIGLGHTRLGNSTSEAGGGRTTRGLACAKGAWIFCLAITALLASATVSLASVELSIHITGLSSKYDESQNGSLFDANSIAGGNGIYQ